jgi:hypothetical protein
MDNQMTDRDNLERDEFQAPARPQMLNVLTILTIIGCSIFLIFTLASPGLISFSKDMLEKTSKTEMTPKQAEDIRKAKQDIAVAEKTMVPMMAIGIVGLVLCFIGALMMRKLKKDGYWLYLGGQLIPVIGGAIVMGSTMYSKPTNFIFPAITLLFIILYTTQRKYLVY